MQSNHNSNLNPVLIVLALISLISSLYLSLNMVNTPLTFIKYAFAERNPVLPNYSEDHQATEPSKMFDNRTNLGSSEMQPTSLIHYQPITPAVLYYTGNSNSAGSNGLAASTIKMDNSTPSSSIVQPVSLAHYQPITPTASSDVSTNNIDISNAVHHASSSGSEDKNHDYNTHVSDIGYHHSSSDKNHSEVNHSYKFHHKSSSTQYNNDPGGGVDNYDSGDHSNSHHHGNRQGDAIIISSADDFEGYGDTGNGHDYSDDYGDDNEDDGNIFIASNGGAYASAGSGGAFASAG